MLKVWIWGKLHLWTTVGFMTNVLDDFHRAGALGFWSMYLKLTKPAYLEEFQPNQCLLLSFQCCLRLFQLRLFDTAPTHHQSKHWKVVRMSGRQIIFVAKQPKYCLTPKINTLFYIKASSSFQCVSFWVNTVYWETCVTMFIVHCSQLQTPRSFFFIAKLFIVSRIFNNKPDVLYCYGVELC